MIAGGGRRRRRVLLGCAVIAVVVIGAAVYAVGAGDDSRDPRAGSVALDDESALFDFGVAPSAYRVDYRVEGLGGDDVVTTSDRLYVSRPFASRLDSYDGPGPEGEPSSVQVSGLGAVRAESASGEVVVVAAAPGPGISDVRVSAALDDALADGRVELRERRRVLGRDCQVVRTAFGLDTGDLERPADPSTYADTCIDADGIVLEEVVVDDGRPLLRRVAIDVEIGPELDEELFETGETTVPIESGGGFFAELAPGSRPPAATFYDAGDGPARFAHVGRYAVVPPQAENFTDVTRRGQRLTFVSDVFVDGDDLVVLDQGGTLGNADPFPGLRGVPVDVDVQGAGEAVLTYGRGGPIVIVRLPEGRFLRARGTGEPEVLLELLASLEPVEGGELELAEPA
jgi:hypothetical protein